MKNREVDKKFAIVLAALIITALMGKYFDVALFVAIGYLIFA